MGAEKFGGNHFRRNTCFRAGQGRIVTLVTLVTSNPITFLGHFSHSHHLPWWLVGMGIFPSAIVIFDVTNVTIREWSRLGA